MQNSEFEKVGIIGAGTMGCGIAAQVANAGGQAVLLDVRSKGDHPNAVAQRGIARIAESDPPLLMTPDRIERIRTGNIVDDLALLADCDWVVEAIVERLDVKRKLYRDLQLHLKPGALLSSNTSTIPLALLTSEMPVSLQERFCITHFFNPVRYMRLLELVGGERTAESTLDRLAVYCDRELGKGIVRCADTPGFLANRVGVFALQAAIHEAMRLGLTVDEADTVFGRPLGIPKTGAFALYDLIGLDLMSDVVRSLRSILPDDDDFHEVGGENELIVRQIEKGFTGRKGKGGFFARIEGKARCLDLSTGEWMEPSAQSRDLAQELAKADMSEILQRNDKYGQFAWAVVSRVLLYSAKLLPEVTSSPQDVDDAMKLGYNWTFGPFEMLDRIGAADFVARIEAENRVVPDFLRAAQDRSFYRVEAGSIDVLHHDGIYRPVDLPRGAVRFHLMRQTLRPVLENGSASLFHLDDGVRVVEFHSKANALDADSMTIVAAAAEDPGIGVMIHNDGPQFSSGVNLVSFLTMIEAGDMEGIDRFLLEFQRAVHALKYCASPVVGAPSGLALGGGYEVLAHCDRIVAHGNSVMGLVECMVGLVPGGGGVKETYLRWYNRTGDWATAAWNSFRQIGFSKTGTSPDLAADLQYFDPKRDRQVMNRDRLFSAAAETIHELREKYQPPSAPGFRLAGASVRERILGFLEEGAARGDFGPHDLTVSQALAEIMTGGDGETGDELDEWGMYGRERAAFLRLSATSQTQARIRSLLETGRPIRN